MRNFFWVALLTLFFSSTCYAAHYTANYAAKPVYVLDITEAIGPAVQDYISQGISIANKQQAALLVIRLNTPGGIEKSIWKIIQDMMASSVPIVSYVAPAGARAAGTGVLIVYASPIAAMAPDTYLGGTSVTNRFKNRLNLGIFQEKIAADRIANIRSLAALRHRNPDWAEKTVQNAATLTSEEALKENAINVIADNIPALLQKLNGTTIDINRIPITLDTKESTIETIHPNWRYPALSIITNPIVVYLLLLIGVLGVFFTFLNPFNVLPGLFGAICLIITFYAFQLLPTSFIGLTLLLVGIACIIREIVIANCGITGAIGMISFFAGSVLMLNMHAPGYYLPLSVPLLISLASTGFIYLTLSFTVKKIQKPQTTHSAIIGKR
jgi:membrane-bound serine protease (ClpP class)